ALGTGGALRRLIGLGDQVLRVLVAVFFAALFLAAGFEAAVFEAVAFVAADFAVVVFLAAALVTVFLAVVVAAAHRPRAANEPRTPSRCR
ncbi:hypothetical protein, partial [Streptomyces lasiicapitis]|uniref:hypothetical protein n=1 Tax=Streptomyces lasiicapitis TaxID=1923961 RepID=UPI00369C8181